MILNEREDLDTWLDFASLCLNGGNVALAERVLQMSQRLSSTYQFTPRPAAGPSNEEMDRRIKLAVLKHQWAVGSKSDALIGLESLIRDSWSLPSISSTSTIGSYWQPTRSLFSSIGSQVNTTDSGMNSRPNAFDPFGNINKLAPLSMSVGNFGSSLTSLNEPPAFNSGGIAPTPMAPSSITPGLSSGKDASIHLESLLLFGEWKVSILGPEEHVDQVTRREVLAMYRTATTVDLQSYQAWHQWGLSNIRAIEEARESQQTPGQNGSRTPTKPINLVRTNSNLGNKGGRFGSTGNHAYLGQEVLVPLAVNAIDGLMKALSLGTKRWSSTVTEDMLNIMLLWFRYGHINEVADALEQRLSMVHLDTWLGVLPQLIARIDHPGKRARELLHSLLARLGEKHAQALVYPLSGKIIILIVVIYIVVRHSFTFNIYC